jgi:hypothetical protein
MLIVSSINNANRGSGLRQKPRVKPSKRLYRPQNLILRLSHLVHHAMVVLVPDRSWTRSQKRTLSCPVGLGGRCRALWMVCLVPSIRGGVRLARHWPDQVQPCPLDLHQLAALMFASQRSLPSRYVSFHSAQITAHPFSLARWTMSVSIFV